MQNIDKKDIPKLAACGVLFAGSLVYATLQMLPQSAPPKPAAKAPPTKVIAASDTNEADASFDAASFSLLTVGKDPFVPNGPSAPEVLVDKMIRPQSAPPTPAVAASAPAAFAPLPMRSPGQLGRNGFDMGQLPNMPSPNTAPSGAPPLASGGSGSGGTLAPAPVPPPPPPAYYVTGVVRGDSNIAVLRGGAGGDERRFVRLGDTVGNGFVVAAVLADRVEIKSGQRRVVWKLGEESRAQPDTK